MTRTRTGKRGQITFFAWPSASGRLRRCLGERKLSVPVSPFPRFPQLTPVVALSLLLAFSSRGLGAEPPKEPPRRTPTEPAFVDDAPPQVTLKKEPLQRTLATIADTTIQVEKRINAIGLAGLVRLKEATPALAAVLTRHDDVNVKVAAIWALREIGEPAAIPALLVVHTQASGPSPKLHYTKKISFPDQDKEMSLIELIEDSIGRLGERVVGQYVKLLAASSGSYRSQSEPAVARQRAALAVLVCVGDRDPRAITAMSDVLKGPGEAYPADFRETAAIGLARVLAARAREFSAVRGRDKIGDDITERLVDTIVQISPSPTREYLASALNIARPTYAVTLLTRHFADNSSETVRLRTIEALGLLRSRESTEALIWALEHEKSPKLRWRAAFGLGLSGKSPTALRALLAALRDESPLVRRAAIRGVGRIAGERAVPILAPSLRDEDPAIRAAAARALGTAKTKAAVPHLLGAAEDKNIVVRSTAVAALGAVPTRESFAAIIKAARDRERPVRFAAVRVLSDIHLPGAYAALIGLVSDTDRTIKAAASNALRIAREHHADRFRRAVIHVMLDTENPASADACDLADFPKDNAVVDALRKASYDRRPGVRASALRMLRTMAIP